VKVDTARPEDPSDLRERGVGVEHVLEDVLSDDQVEALVGERGALRFSERTPSTDSPQATSGR
jgi:hypothetical protein